VSNILAFEEVRPGITADLKAAKIKTTEYVGETITPPTACVIPSQPYLEWRSGGEGVPFGHLVTRVDVLLVSHRETSKKAAELIEGMIADAVRALSAWNVRRVSQPGIVQLQGAKFIGAVLTIETTVKEL
jgi:hypothetical protein